MDLFAGLAEAVTALAARPGSEIPVARVVDLVRAFVDPERGVLELIGHLAKIIACAAVTDAPEVAELAECFFRGVCTKDSDWALYAPEVEEVVVALAVAHPALFADQRYAKAILASLWPQGRRVIDDGDIFALGWMFAVLAEIGALAVELMEGVQQWFNVVIKKAGGNPLGVCGAIHVNAAMWIAADCPFPAELMAAWVELIQQGVFRTVYLRKLAVCALQKFAAASGPDPGLLELIARLLAGDIPYARDPAELPGFTCEPPFLPPFTDAEIEGFVIPLDEPDEDAP
jgi:hypothetical protein